MRKFPIDPAKLPRLGSYAFIGFGALITLMGVITMFDDPAGAFAILFGLAFVGGGWLMRRLFVPPKGVKQVAVEGHSAGITTWDGRTGTRSQASLIRVPENATETEIAEARAQWLREQWAARPDWAEGLVQSDDTLHGGLAWWGAGLWCLFTLAALGAGLLWGDIAWLVAAGGTLFTLGFLAAAIRQTVRRRKFGQSRFQLDRTPLILGDRVTGEVLTGVPRDMRLADGFAVKLSCVHRWETTRGSGDSKRTVVQRDTLWETSARHPGSTRAGSDKVAVPVSFALPADRPAATLGGGREGILWELALSASVPGIDYSASFELPVLDRETAETLAKA